MPKSDNDQNNETKSAEAENAPAAPQQQPARIKVDDSNAVACYGNFCRVSGTPEELIIDIGMNKQPTGIPSEPLKVSQRIILNFYTAKRLLAALQMAVQRHEATFGVLETDVQRRVRPEVFQQFQSQTAGKKGEGR